MSNELCLIVKPEPACHAVLSRHAVTKSEAQKDEGGSPRTTSFDFQGTNISLEFQ